MSEESIHVQLQQKQDYQFDIHFGGEIPTLMGDEPAPLGAGQGPSPVQLLAAAVGNCLSDSLLFALRKFNGCVVDGTRFEQYLAQQRRGHFIDEVGEPRRTMIEDMLTAPVCPQEFLLGNWFFLGYHCSLLISKSVRTAYGTACPE